MELAILCGLGLLGYNLNRAGKEQRFQPRWQPPGNDPRKWPFRDDGAVNDELRAADTSLYDARFQASLDPRKTGIIPPDCRTYSQRDLSDSILKAEAQGQPIPYFGSERAQNTRDSIKQQRMELFTGSIDNCAAGGARPGWQHKQETGPLFAPQISAVRVNSAGKAGDPGAPSVDNAGTRFWVSGTQNNTGPCDAIRVGPGLNLPKAVPASGGFHPYFRVLPKNVGAYKKNSLLARTTAGGSSIQKRTQVAQVTQHVPPPMATYEQRPPDPTRAAVTAPTARGVFSLGCVNNNGAQQYTGIAATSVPAESGRMGDSTRYRADSNGCLPLLNAGMPGKAVGAYTNQQYAYSQHAFKTQREQCMPELGAPSSSAAAPGAYAVTGVAAPPTIRQATQQQQHEAAPSQPSSMNLRPMDLLRTTNKETLEGRTPASNLAAQVPAAMRGPGTSQDRRHQDLVSYTPGAGSSGLGQMYESNPGAVKLRDDTHCQRAGNFEAGTVYYAALGETSKCMNKVQSQAYYRAPDLAVAREQLCSNPYAMKSWT